VSERVSVIGQGPAAPAGSTIVSIDPPAIGDEGESEEESDAGDEERPLSRDELRAKTLRGLTKREGQQASRQQKRKSRGDLKALK
jgi:coiled-coil domain-containing protein 63/114